jgi:hypothetical protein
VQAGEDSGGVLDGDMKIAESVNGKCDVCGRPATNFRVHRIQPYEASTDKRKRETRIIARMEYGCDDHEVWGR